MAWNSYVNQSAASFSANVPYAVLKQLTSGSPSWTCLGSGDGSGGNYNASGDLFTQCVPIGGPPISYNYGNPYSWFRITDPSNNHEFVFQYITESDPTYFRPLWLIKYSTSDGFTGGTPNSSTPPTAADEVNVKSDSESTYTRPTGASSYVHLAWDDTAVGGTYPFWFWGASIRFLYKAVAKGDPLISDKSLYLNTTLSLLYNSGANLSSDTTLLKGLTSGVGYGGTYPIPYPRDASGNFTPGTLGEFTDVDDHILIPATVRPAGRNYAFGQLHTMSFVTGSYVSTDTLSDGTDEYLLINNVAWRGWPLGGPAPIFS